MGCSVAHRFVHRLSSSPSRPAFVAGPASVRCRGGRQSSLHVSVEWELGYTGQAESTPRSFAIYLQSPIVGVVDHHVTVAPVIAASMSAPCRWAVLHPSTLVVLVRWLTRHRYFLSLCSPAEGAEVPPPSSPAALVLHCHLSSSAFLSKAAGDDLRESIWSWRSDRCLTVFMLLDLRLVYHYHCRVDICCTSVKWHSQSARSRYVHSPVVEPTLSDHDPHCQVCLIPSSWHSSPGAMELPQNPLRLGSQTPSSSCPLLCVRRLHYHSRLWPLQYRYETNMSIRCMRYVTTWIKPHTIPYAALVYNFVSLAHLSFPQNAVFSCTLRSLDSRRNQI